MTKINVKNTIKEKRNVIAKRRIAALANLEKGSVKKGHVKDLYKNIDGREISWTPCRMLA